MHRGRRPLLQPAGAPEVPEVGRAPSPRRSRGWSTQLALAYPEVGFTLTSAGRKVLECPPVANAARAVLPAVRRARGSGGGGEGARASRVFGFVAALAEQGPTRGPAERLRQPAHREGQDDRPRDHRGLQRGVDQGAQPGGASVHRDGARPGGRQRAPDEGRGALPRSVAGARGRAARASATRSARGRRPNCSCAAGAIPAAAAGRRVASPGLLGGVYPNRWSRRDRPTAVVRQRATSRLARQPRRLRLSALPRRVTAPLDGPVGALGVRPMIPLGQFRDTFIIAIDDEGIAIIDQHVAHERVLFERVMQRLTERAGSRASGCSSRWWSSCRPSGARRCCSARAELERFGFEVEEFGGSSVRRRPRCRRCSTPDEIVEARARAGRGSRRPRPRAPPSRRRSSASRRRRRATRR